MPQKTPPIVGWTTKSFEELSSFELYQMMQFRQGVFVVEQKCCYQDADGLDLSCRHLFGKTSSGELIAYLRVLAPGQKYEEPSVGRLAVDQRLRKTGLGKRLTEEGLRLVHRLYPGMGLRIVAQLYLEKFYAGYGFVSVSEPFIEDGIPHVEMYLDGSSLAARVANTERE
jgi:ElaA protein